MDQSIGKALLYEALETGDMTLVRALIIRQISRDRRLKEFETPGYIKYVKEAISKDFEPLFVDDDEAIDFLPEEEWSNDLWSRMCISLEHKFTKKKLNYIVEIMRHLRDDGHPEYQIAEVNQYSTSHLECTKSNKKKKRRFSNYLPKAIKERIGGNSERKHSTLDCENFTD